MEFGWYELALIIAWITPRETATLRHRGRISGSGTLGPPLHRPIGFGEIRGLGDAFETFRASLGVSATRKRLAADVAEARLLDGWCGEGGNLFTCHGA